MQDPRRRGAWRPVASSLRATPPLRFRRVAGLAVQPAAARHLSSGFDPHRPVPAFRLSSTASPGSADWLGEDALPHGHSFRGALVVGIPGF